MTTNCVPRYSATSSKKLLTQETQRRYRRSFYQNVARVHTLVLVRSGKCTSSRDGRFVGWDDTSLTETGKLSASLAGLLLSNNRRLIGRQIDKVFTSRLKRTIKSSWVIMEQLDCMQASLQNDWSLNERHLGHLQGLSRVEADRTYGRNQVQQWLIDPNSLPCIGSHGTRADRIISDDAASSASVPALLGESNLDMFERVRTFWHNVIAPSFGASSVSGTSCNSSDKAILVCLPHGPLRVLVHLIESQQQQQQQQKYQQYQQDPVASARSTARSVISRRNEDNISTSTGRDSIISAINALHIPVGVPLLYRFDAQLNCVPQEESQHEQQQVNANTGSSDDGGVSAASSGIRQGLFLGTKRALAAKLSKDKDRLLLFD